MNDAVERTTSSLAIVEKKPQKPGGCVGIFFQLFDWNRRFAKKKLFSKKLLPPVRLKPSSKNFGGSEKQSKLRLIADENSGGFPNAKKNKGGATNLDLERRDEMRAPSLVARLMGLESIPALQREKSKKVPLSGFGSNHKAEKLVDNICGYPREESNLEKRGTKQELRPQKLQKTGICDRQPSTMTRFSTETLPFKNVLSKSKKHPKLPTPVKSPRNLSKKSPSKLMGAATRILEPGLQTNRSKFALTYSDTMHSTPKRNTNLEGTTGFSPSQREDFDDLASVAPKGQPSCSNCGHFLDNMDSKPHGNEQPLLFASLCVESSCQGSERSKPRERLEHYPIVSPPVKDNFSSQQPKKDLPLYFSSNHKTQSQYRMFPEKGTVPLGSKFNDSPIGKLSRATVVNETKNYALLNRNVSTRSRVSARIDNASKFEMEKRIANKQKELLPPGRKRRPTNISLVKKQELGYDVHSIDQQCHQSGFTFKSPMKPKSVVNPVENKRVRNDFCCGASLQKSELSENSRRAKFDKPFPLSGDALGAIIEQKLHELTSQGEDIGGNNPKRTTAMILQELISALNSEMPFQQNKSAPSFDGKVNFCNHSRLSNSTSYTSSQGNAMAVKLCVDQPLECEHPSPGSVLEGCFSNESCLSSCIDDNLGTITTAKSSSKELVYDILDGVSEILSCINLGNCGLNGSKLDHAKEVLSNSELVFQTVGFSIKHLLIDELETLGTLLWMNFGSSLCIEEGNKEMNQLKGFAFNSVIEYLDLRFEIYPLSVSKVSTKLPLCINTNMLLFEIVEEVRRWGELSSFFLDQLIDKEMSCSLGEWTEFETETFETSMEISRHVYYALLDEIVVDFCKC